MKACIKIFLIAALLFAGLQSAGAQIGGDALRRDVEFLSDSLCTGRATGTAGNVEAAAYIIRRLREAGYEPGLQSFRIDSSRVGRNIIAGSSSEQKSGRKPVIVLMAYYDGLGILHGRLYPGADSNASGVAALLAMAERLKGREDVLLAFLDAHNVNMAGADTFHKSMAGRKITLVANLDILGSTLSPVDKYWPDFLIALGADKHRILLEECNEGLGLHYYHTYYRSRTFTDLFYRKAGDHKGFVADGVHTILFTSGITVNTNKPEDRFGSLDYDIFAKRVEFIARFIENYGRK